MAEQQTLQEHNIPQHVAVIMDGNGRWAKQRRLQRMFGHRNGVDAVRAIAEAAAEQGVKYLTLYAFSTENWARPKIEVNALMSLLVDAIDKEEVTLNRNNIKFTTIGDAPALPQKVQSKLKNIIRSTAKNTGMTLVIALSYSGRWDITTAVRQMCRDAEQGKLSAADVDEALLASYLSTSGMPDPDLFIRTGGDLRVSNFLIWQIAYSELYFTPVLWPDFGKQHFAEAIKEFQKRERRFGRVTEE
ncbi:MAG: isoprenyl transferase [Prevotellaceae bacterium]|jgi:undecaprenyl diphosphate synthase|nr:isoprenyl transferase [Prevotellaceae bacterium]